MTDEIPVKLQLEILEQSRQMWVNTRYQAQAKMQAAKNLIVKNILQAGEEKPIFDELTKIEGWIAEYDEQISKLKQSAPADTGADSKVPAPNGKRDEPIGEKVNG